ncbi:MAG: nuclease [Proteobacteria bacterium]|nr:nuclease [Pseudomonadota bacterium]
MNDLYVLVDGENMDWQLSTILNRQPKPEDRPRWDAVLEFSRELWDGRNLKPLFFMHVRRNSSALWSFIQMLQAVGFRPVLLEGEDDQPVVDIGIQRTLEALVKRTGDVLLMSHDKDFCEFLSALDDGERRLAMLAFPEYLAGDYDFIENLEVFDLEHDAKAFPNGPLPRLSPIPVDEFDPEALLDSL